MPDPNQDFPANLPLPNWNAWAHVLPRQIVQAPKVAFQYTANFGMNGQGTNLAASAVNQTAQTTINNDGHFLLVAVLGRATTTTVTNLFNAAGGAAGNVVMPVMIQFADSSGTQWSDQPIHWDNMIGWAQNPFYVPYPKLLLKNTAVVTSLTNLTATAAQVQLVFHGFKVFTDWAPSYSQRGV